MSIRCVSVCSSTDGIISLEPQNCCYKHYFHFWVNLGQLVLSRILLLYPVQNNTAGDELGVYEPDVVSTTIPSK